VAYFTTISSRCQTRRRRAACSAPFKTQCGQSAAPDLVKPTNCDDSCANRPVAGRCALQLHPATFLRAAVRKWRFSLISSCLRDTRNNRPDSGTARRTAIGRPARVQSAVPAASGGEPTLCMQLAISKHGWFPARSETHSLARFKSLKELRTSRASEWLGAASVSSGQSWRLACRTSRKMLPPR